MAVAGWRCGSRLSNDDMPFLVDSVAAALAAANIADCPPDPSGAGRGPRCKGCVARHFRGSTGKRESFIYLETARVDAKERNALAERLVSVLHDVRCAVTDWRKMQDAMAADADSLPDGEGRGTWCAGSWKAA